MKSKILITGAAGFIGFNLIKYLLKKNYEIIGIDNLNTYYNKKLKIKRISQLKSKNFQFIKLDLRKSDQIKKKLKKIKFGLIIHLAAQPGVRYSVKEPHSYIENNILAFSNILELTRDKKVKLIYSSSSSVYGDSRTYPLKENQKLNPKNIYAMTKNNNEEHAKIYAQNYNLSILGLRFFTVFGEWGRPDMMVIKFLISAINNKKFQVYNNGNHFRDFTYIGDLCEMVYPIIKDYKKINNKNEIFNICSGKSISLKYIIKKLALLTKYNKTVNRKYNHLEVLKTHGSNIKINKFARKKFNFTNIDQAIINTFEWFKKNKVLFKL